MSQWTVSLLLCQFRSTCISFCLRDVIMDCETVYVQMLFLLFKGCLCVLYHFCASYTCISPLFKFSSVQFKMVFRRSKKPLCTLVQDGIYALKKTHMHSSSVQDGIYALKKAHMHSSSVQDGIYALKKAHMHSSLVQDGIYALKKTHMRSTLSLIL